MSEEHSVEDKITESKCDNENSSNVDSEEKRESKSREKSSSFSEEKKQNIKRKVDILLRATGDAPIMKAKKWAVESDRTVGSIIEFIKKYLKLDVSDSLYLYVNQSFAPSPDQIILNLFECFGSDGKLVLHYCKTPAWG